MDLFNIIVTLFILNLIDIREYLVYADDFDVTTKANILGRFFSLEGLSVNTKDKDLIGKYDKEIIEKMKESVDNFHDTLRVFNLNVQVNLLIYKLKTLNLPQPEACKPYEPMDEALFQAIDLMLPDSSTEPVFKLAKEDLRKFYMEQPGLAKELLSRILAELNDVNLHTDDLVRFMKNFYNRWIPLGRLAKFIEQNAKNA